VTSGGETDPSALDWRETLALERRRSTELSMWTIPGASLAAQAFLYTRGFDPATSGLARLLVAIVGLATAVATIQILREQAHRMDVFRQFVHAKRDERGVESIRRSALLDELERLGEEPRRREPSGLDATTTWLLVMAMFALVDLFTGVAAVLELLGAWDPFAT
jgi:hypothetical protein